MGYLVGTACSGALQPSSVKGRSGYATVFVQPRFSGSSSGSETPVSSPKMPQTDAGSALNGLLWLCSVHSTCGLELVLPPRTLASMGLGLGSLQSFLGEWMPSGLIKVSCHPREVLVLNLVCT